MAAATNASLPTTFVSEIPGRFVPTFIVDKRSPASITTSTGTTSRNVFLPRAESVNADFQTPTNIVEEVGTNYRTGEYDDLAENKLTITSYDVGTQALSLITATATPTGTTTFTPNTIANAAVDVVMQYASPDGNIFYSEYMGDMVIDAYGMNLKAKSAAMEDFSMVGFNTLGFRGFFVTKAYVVQAADVTANSLSSTVMTALYGTNEGPVGLPVPSGSAPPSYWIQRGSLNFIKIEKYRAATGWTRFKETTGSLTTGYCKYATGALNFFAGDLVAGDLILLTYATYACNVAGYTAVPLTTLDTSDPIAVDTRLTPITISAITPSGGLRGQSFDMKLNLKRDRAEGIGDVDGLWGPPAQPDVTIGLDVKYTGPNIGSLLQTGNQWGTDNGGTVSGDFIDPNYITRVMLNTATPIVAQINDPRNSGTTLKTLTCPTAVFKQRQIQVASKNSTTLKYTGSDRVGNISVAVSH